MLISYKFLSSDCNAKICYCRAIKHSIFVTELACHYSILLCRLRAYSSGNGSALVMTLYPQIGLHVLGYTYEEKTTKPRALAVHDALERMCNQHYTTT